MKRYALLLYILFLAAAVRAATPRPQPLYIVNGKETSEIRSIPPEDIENVEMLPADEETIARYGQRAAHGVMLITLRYDRPASFPADSAFGSYIARQVRWDESEPTARVVLRYKITPDGETVVQQELESTDSRLKRRVLKAVAEAPRWHPAQKNGAPLPFPIRSLYGTCLRPATLQARRTAPSAALSPTTSRAFCSRRR